MKKYCVAALIIIASFFNCAFINPVASSLAAEVNVESSQAEDSTEVYPQEKPKVEAEIADAPMKDAPLLDEDLIEEEQKIWISPFYQLSRYLEASLQDSDWGGYGYDWSFKYNSEELHLYIVDEEVVENVMKAYTGDPCRVIRHYTKFTVKEQKELCAKLENAIIPITGDRLSTRVYYNIYTPSPSEDRSLSVTHWLENPFIYFSITSEYKDYYKEVYDEFLKVNNVEEKVKIRYDIPSERWKYPNVDT